MGYSVSFGQFHKQLLPLPSGEIVDREYSASYWNPLPQKVSETITSKLEEGVVRSWKSDCPVPKENLTYVQLSHWNNESKVSVGELIVNKNVAHEISEIFAQVFRGKFPIEKMYLIDNYEADDDRSMLDNNSSAFCSRAITAHPGVFSVHSYGRAVDINPKINPYHNRRINMVAPASSEMYLDRSQEIAGMIKTGDVCYQAFIDKGWSWGGNWTDPKDYQHFEKKT